MSTDRYGVVGHPVAHSWSPFIHGLFARDTDQSMTYRLFDFNTAEFAPRVRDFFSLGGRGLNVTVPHKVAAVALANQLTPRAAAAGAVNTLAVQKNGALLGDNTDGAGLVQDLCENLSLVINHRRVLIIGAGGATRGIIGPLLGQHPDTLVIANRTAERARELAKQFGSSGAVQGVGLDELGDESFDLIVNATSASLSGDVPAIAPTVVRSGTVCYDLAYGKTHTAFTDWATAAGSLRALQGWGMLVEQAAESFKLWRGVRPATAPVLAALMARALSAS